MNKGTMQQNGVDTSTFYYCLNLLIGYYSSFIELEDELPSISSENAGELDSASRILDVLWTSPSYIRRFVAENPCQLNTKYLRTIALWQYALRDVFLCFKQDGKNSILATNGERLFEVGSLKQPIAKLVGTTPALVTMVLLPYQNKLVCDGRVKCFGSKRASGNPAFVDRFISKAAESPIISCPDDLVRYVKTRPSSNVATARFEQRFKKAPLTCV